MTSEQRGCKSVQETGPQTQKGGCTVSQSSAPVRAKLKRHLSALAWSTDCLPAKGAHSPTARGSEGWDSWGPPRCLHCADEPDQNQP